MDGDAAARAFSAAAQWFAETVPATRGREDEPGPGAWTVRDLVGHTSRSLLTLESHLDAGARAGAGPSDLDGPVAHHRATADALADGAAIAQRGRGAGAALGDDLPAAVTALVARVLPRLDAPDDAPVITPFGRATRRVPGRRSAPGPPAATGRTDDLGASSGRAGPE